MYDQIKGGGLRHPPGVQAAASRTLVVAARGLPEGGHPIPCVFCLLRSKQGEASKCVGSAATLAGLES